MPSNNYQSVLLPEKSHGQRSLLGCSPWGHYSRTRLSIFTFTFHFHALEKEMATHSSVLSWRIPGMGKPGGLPSMGSHRVGHECSDLAAAAAVVMTIIQQSQDHSDNPKQPCYWLETREYFSVFQILLVYNA